MGVTTHTGEPTTLKSMKPATDKPDFPATEALIPRTTTNLDTNPVLSNISIPTKMAAEPEDFSPQSNGTLEPDESEYLTDTGAVGESESPTPI